MTLAVHSLYKAVLFDFGGVFILSPFGAVEMLAKEKGIDAMHLAETIFGSYHLDTEHPWHQLERGEISLEETRNRLLQLSRERGMDVDLWEVLTKMAESKTGSMINQQVVQLLREVKQKGYQTAIVTNNVKEFSDAWQSMIPVKECVDVIVDSAFEGIRKPDPAIFQLALERLGLKNRPGECIFLDDVLSNVESAQRVGLQGIVVTPDPDETVRALWQTLARR